MNHAQGEFARGDVSTNAVEGLFSRLKKSLRASRITKNRQQAYGFFLEEFLGRERFLSARSLGTADWRHYAFWKLIEVLS